MIIIDSNLNHVAAFQPESMSLNLEERKSTANITLGPDAPAIDVGSWLMDDTDPGAGIIWRVKTVETTYNTNTRTASLEHIISTLRDSVIFGEVKTGDIAGNASATTCSAWDAVRKALSYQSIWVLDGFDYSVSNPYSFNGDTVFAALETISSSLQDCYWTYDLSRFPFRLSIRRLSDAIDSEMRMDRNIQSLKKTVDRSRMYTRFYPIGKNNLKITGDYISKNENLYGTVSVVETDASKETEAELLQWARERLDRHCEPSVTVQISGLDLSAATGEPLDHFTVNTKCRVPLPEFGTSIVEKVTKLSWSDKLKEPQKVNITLANLLEDVSSIINSANNASKSGSRAKAKKDEEDHAWFVDTTEHVGMVAEAVAGPGADKDWSRVSSIFVDGEGIHQKVVRAENDIVVAQTAIEANEYAITLEAKRATDAEGKLQGKITVEADRITNEVTRAINEERSLRGALEVQADRVGMTVGVTDSRPIRYIYQTQYLPRPGDESVIYYCQDTKKYYEWKNSTNSYHLTEPGKYIKAGEICVAINESGETEAVIEADKIHLLGQTIANTITANYIDSKISTLAVLHAKDITANTITAGVNLYLPNGVSVYSQGIWQLSLSQSGDTYTLKELKLNGSERTVGSFSRATTLTSGWSGGTFTVTASPQGKSHHTSLKSVANSDITWNGFDGTFMIKSYNNDSETAVDTGRECTITYPGTLNWSYSNTASTSSTDPGGAAKQYSINKNYNYSYFNVTVNGVSKRIVLKLIS